MTQKGSMPFVVILPSPLAFGGSAAVIDSLWTLNVRRVLTLFFFCKGGHR